MTKPGGMPVCVERESVCMDTQRDFENGFLRGKHTRWTAHRRERGATCSIRDSTLDGRLWKWGPCFFQDASSRESIYAFCSPSDALSSFPFRENPHPCSPSPSPTTTVRNPNLTIHVLLTNPSTETMVSYKSVFRAIFRSEHTDDAVAVPSPSKFRQKPSRAFTVPASPARPKAFIEQPVAGPSTRKQFNPYTNNPSRHSAVALRDIISPRPRLRKNSLPSLFPEERSTLPSRVSASPIPIVEDSHSQEQLQLSASPVPDSRQFDDEYLRKPHPSLDLGHSDLLNGDSKHCDHLDASVPVFGLRESSDISLLLSSEPADARKAISKRLEGLTMALDMFQPVQAAPPATLLQHPGFTSRGLTKLNTSLDVTHPLITFPLSPRSSAALGSASLSPIENWRDEEGEEQSSDDDYAEGDEEEEVSYFHIPGSRFFQSSHSSSSVSSSTSDLPPTPVDLSTASVDAVQLLPTFLPKSPVPFNLGPVVQSRVDNCKATPTPVVSVDTCDAQSGIVRV